MSRKLGQIIEQNNTEITGSKVMAMDPSTLPSRKKKEGVTRPSPGSPAILISCPPQLQVKLGMLEYLKEEGQLKGAPGRSSSMVERALCDNAVWGISTLQSVTSHLCVAGEPSQLVGSLAWTNSGIVLLSTTDALSGINKLLFVSCSTPEKLAQHIYLIPFQNCGPEMEGSGGILLSAYYSRLRTNEGF